MKAYPRISLKNYLYQNNLYSWATVGGTGEIPLPALGAIDRSRPSTRSAVKLMAHCLALKSCWSRGKTREQAVGNVREAVEVYLKPEPAQLLKGGYQVPRATPRLEGSALYAGRYSYPLGSGGDAVRQANIPPSLALIHPQNDAGGAGRMIGGGVEQ